MSAEQTGSQHKNLQKRMNLAIGRSNNLKTIDSKTKDVHGNSKTVKADDIPHVDDKLSKRDNGIGKITMNSKTKDGISHRSDEQYGVVGGGGNRKFNAVNSDRKSKRIYVDHGNKEQRKFQNNVRTSNVKEFSKPGLNTFKDDFAKGKRSGAPRGRRVSENASLDKKGGTNLRVEMKAFHAGKDSELDCGGSGMLNKGFKIKTNSYKQFNRNPNNVVGSLGKSGRTKFQDKKGILDNAESTDDRPKKKKRVIRLDRHDITNKRLDDGKATSDSFKDKKEKSGENEDVDMSKNAQFRAIQPSLSILSFVEKNLLGRRREIELRRAGYNTELSVPLDNTPLSTNSERERIEETVFRNKLTFFAAAKISSSIPPPDLPEIAFAGRSNVGKSSLLNSLTRQWGVVRTSDKPGLTQTINFFKLGPKLCLVDLPGYGFAYAKEEVKEAWEDLVKEYVSTRVGLKQVCLLIDTKWGMKPRDHELIDLMERSQTNYQVVLTKTDLVFPIDVARRAMQIEESLKAKKSAVQPVLMVSSKSGAGIRCLRTALANIARFAKL